MKETSFMTVIPADEEDLRPEKLIERISQSRIVKVYGSERDMSDENSPISLKISIDDRNYTVNLSMAEPDFPDFFRTVHFFSDLDFQKIEKIEKALTVEIDYTGDFVASYHDQLKIINCLVPDKLAVVDLPSEKILSGKWVKLAAESDIPPAPRYLYTAQAITNDSGEVWIHSHGLRRCGLPDLEILGSNRDMAQVHYQILENAAIHMIDEERCPEEGEPTLLARLAEGVPMITVLADWEDALKLYPDATVGTEDDRDEYHAEGTKVIMLYLNAEDMENGKISRIQELDKYLGHNTMFMISHKETERMRSLARERIDYVCKVSDQLDSGVEVLMKLGLRVDDEYLQPETDPDEQREHIWFTLKAVEQDEEGPIFICELMQEPYYVKAMQKGSTGSFRVADVTDWAIFRDEKKYTPDDAYLIG